MAVYIDPLFHGGQMHSEKSDLWSHMAADTLEELHAFAEKIGRKRCWFHKGDHYDLTPSFREKAAQAGAIEMTALDFSKMMVNRRRARRGLPPI